MSMLGYKVLVSYYTLAK